MTLTEVKTTDLIGPALDWAVLMAIQYIPFDNATEAAFFSAAKSCDFKMCPCYSTDWAHGGPLIEKYRLHLHCDEPSASFLQSGMRIGYTAKTVLIAACRAIVASTLGVTVSVPAELLATLPAE